MAGGDVLGSLDRGGDLPPLALALYRALRDNPGWRT